MNPRTNCASKYNEVLRRPVLVASAASRKQDRETPLAHPSVRQEHARGFQIVREHLQMAIQRSARLADLVKIGGGDVTRGLRTEGVKAEHPFACGTPQRFSEPCVIRGEERKNSSELTKKPRNFEDFAVFGEQERDFAPVDRICPRDSQPSGGKPRQLHSRHQVNRSARMTPSKRTNGRRQAEKIAQRARKDQQDAFVFHLGAIRVRLQPERLHREKSSIAVPCPHGEGTQYSRNSRKTKADTVTIAVCRTALRVRPWNSSATRPWCGS